MVNILFRGGDWSRNESNEFRSDFYRIFRIIFHLPNQSNPKFSNWMNFERIQHLKNLTPPYSWSWIKSNKFRINFHRIFRIFFALLNQSNHKFSNPIERISNEFQFDSTPTKTLKCSIMFHILLTNQINIKMLLKALLKLSKASKVPYCWVRWLY